MTIEPPRVRTVATVDELHLPGGLRAGTDRAGCLYIGPTVEGGGLQFSGVTDTGRYRTALIRMGLDLIGYETLTEEHNTWTFLTPRELHHAISHWPAIAHAANQAGNNTAEELARHVAFALRGASIRIRDISRAYGWQCSNVVRNGIQCGRRFSNVELFDLYLALHSFLTEAASARDYLARYISICLYRHTKPADTMHTLYQSVRSGQVTASPLLQELVLVCDKDNADGWLARLGRYRNLIVHEAPIDSFVQSKFIVANAIVIAGRTLPAVHVSIPQDPFAEAATSYVDALERFRFFMLKLLELSARVIGESPVRPEFPTLTDEDLRSAP